MKLVSILLITLFSTGNFTFSAQTAKDRKVTFNIKKGFSTINGQFSKIDYKIVLDKDGSETISGTVGISSISTGNAKRDKHLQNEVWLDATNHPQLVIQSKKIIRKKGGDYTGTFDIKIKGKTETKEIPFEVITNGGSKFLKATFTLSISTFDIGGGVVDLLVGDKVTVNVELPF
ncbi:YceI family protein [Flavobacterium sp. JP2137]|uniref:YceI family protein n=1 Tax=Flavobacterium sp. JP2137 TaxID=3414510 RepID=UPI003D2FD84E